MTHRAAVRLTIATILVLLAALAAVLIDRADDHATYQRVETTNGTTTTTTWLETQASLPAGFDPLKLTPTTTTRRAPASTTTRRAPAPSDATTAELEAIIRAGFARFGTHVADQAVNVAHCEAPHDEIPGALDPNATGAEGEVGLLQLHPRYQIDRAAKFGWTMHDLYDPTKNVAVAADLYAERGWQPWTCRTAA